VAEQLRQVKPVLNAADIATFRHIVSGLVVDNKLLEYITRIVTETRNNPSLYLGGSPRASLAIMKASKALAAIRGRDFVVPEDIVEITPHVLRHRIILTPEKEMEGITPDEMIQQLIERVEVPR
jgi:MoxR-like ATPase